VLSAEGAAAVERAHTALLIGVSALAVGCAQRGLDMTVGYAKERVQFGRPIGSFQALKHRMADIFKAIDSADHLVDQAAASAAQGGAMAALWAMQAKASATDIAAFVTGDCVQLHGGVGFTWEYDPHIYLKRARMNEMLLGANGALRDRALVELKRAVLDGIDVMELAL
jgi:alkylation response protein AidB-like acyl-CoA dehydrogenase